MGDMAERVIAAILAQQDYKTTPDQRQRAYEFLETLKSTPRENLNIATKLITHQNPVIQHFALHSLEVLVKAHWNKLDNGQKNHLKTYAKKVFSNGAKLSQNFLREKAIDFLTEIAVRDWPQRWPNMLQEVFAVAGVNRSDGDDLLMFMVLMLVRNLASKIIAFDPNVPEKRCREIQVGLQASMAPIRFLILKTTRKNLGPPGRKMNPKQAKIVRTALDAIQACIDWVDPVFIYGNGSPQDLQQNAILPILLSLLNRSEFCITAAEVLTIICQKNTMQKYHRWLRELWVPVLKTNRQIFTMSSDIQDTTEWVRLMRAVVGCLKKLMINHYNLITPGTNGDAKTAQVRLQLLEHSRDLLKHRVVSVALMGAEIWMWIMRYKFKELVDESRSKGIILNLIKITMSQNIRQKWDGLHSEFELERDHDMAFSSLRSKLNVVMELCSTQRTNLTLRAVVEAYLQPVMAISRARNMQDFAKIEQAMEGYNCGLEHAIRAIPNNHTHDPQIIEGLGVLLQNLIKIPVQNVPVGLVVVKSQAIGMLHPIYEHNQKALMAALQHSLQGVQYRPQGQESIPAERLPKDVMIARRKSLLSLINITKKHKTRLVGMFRNLFQQISETLSKEGWLRAEERMSLLECMIPIANTLPQAQYFSFIKHIVDTPLKNFDRIASSTFNEYKTFAVSIGFLIIQAPDTKQAREHRQQIWWAVDLMRVIVRNTSNQEHMKALFPNLLSKQRLTHLLKLTGCCHYLISPAFLSVALPEIKVALSESRLKMEDGLKHLPTETHLVIEEIHMWFRTVRGCALNLLGIAAKETPNLFHSVATGDVLSVTVFESLPSMPLIYLKVLLDQFLPNFLDCYPLQTEMQQRAFVSIFGKILNGLLSRLTSGWQTHVQALEQKIAASSEKDEIRFSSSLVDTTKSFTRAIADLLKVPSGVAGIRSVRNMFYPVTMTSGSSNPDKDRKSRKGEANPYVPSAQEIRRSNLVVNLILQNTMLTNLLMTVMMALMLWPEPNSSITACALVVRFLPAIKNNLHQPQGKNAGMMLLRLFETSLKVLSRLRKEIEEAQHSGHIFMCKELYCTFVPLGIKQFRQILLKCGVPAGELEELEKDMAKHSSDKIKRKLFKGMLMRHIIGRQAGTGRCFQVKDLPEGFVTSYKDLKARHKKKGGAGAGDSLEGVFEYLFDK